MRTSGSTDSLVMGLDVNAIVATGAKPKNSLIFLATSGRVENAMNAVKYNKCKPLNAVTTVGVCACVTYSGPLRVSNIVNLFLRGHFQDVIHHSWKIL